MMKSSVKNAILLYKVYFDAFSDVEGEWNMWKYK